MLRRQHSILTNSVSLYRTILPNMRHRHVNLVVVYMWAIFYKTNWQYNAQAIRPLETPTATHIKNNKSNNWLFFKIKLHTHKTIQYEMRKSQFQYSCLMMMMMTMMLLLQAICGALAYSVFVDENVAGVRLSPANRTANVNASSSSTTTTTTTTASHAPGNNTTKEQRTPVVGVRVASILSKLFDHLAFKLEKQSPTNSTPTTAAAAAAAAATTTKCRDPPASVLDSLLWSQELSMQKEDEAIWSEKVNESVQAVLASIDSLIVMQRDKRSVPQQQQHQQQQQQQQQQDNKDAFVIDRYREHAHDKAAEKKREHVENSQCVPQMRNMTELNERSLCPWKYLVEKRTNKYPHVRVHVKCTCETCRPMIGSLSLQLQNAKRTDGAAREHVDDFWMPRFLYGCMPVLRATPVLVRVNDDDDDNKTCGADGFYEWKKSLEYINVACVCSLRRSYINVG